MNCIKIKKKLNQTYKQGSCKQELYNVRKLPKARVYFFEILC